MQKSRNAYERKRELGRKMANVRWAKDRARRDEIAKNSEPPILVNYSKPLWSITVHNHHQDSEHVLDVYPSAKGRSDQYRVMVDGELWKEAVGLAKLQDAIRMAMFRQTR